MSSTAPSSIARRLLRRATVLAVPVALVGSALAGLGPAMLATAGSPTSGPARLMLSATASPASVSRAGQPIAYTFLVRNTGTQTLGGLVVRAPFSGLSALVCTPVPLGGTLAPAATTTCRATRTTTLTDLQTSVLSDTAKASATTSTQAVNAAAPVRVAVTALAPQPVEGGDDSSSAVLGGPTVILPGSTNDLPGEPGGPAIDPSRTVFVAVPGVPTGDQRIGPKHAVRADGNEWWIRPDGSVRVHPTTPVAKIDYRVYDTAGHSAVGHLKVTTHPGATCPGRDLSVSHPVSPNHPVTFDPLAACDPGQDADGMRSAFDPASVLLNIADAEGTLSYDHKHLGVTEISENQVAGTDDLTQVGSFTVNADGTLTFAAAAGFSGTVPEVEVTAVSTSGVSVLALVDGVEVSGAQAPPPQLSATDDHAETTSGTPVTLAAELDDVDPGSLIPGVTFPSDQLPRLPAGSKVGSDGSLTVPGQGVYRPTGLNVVLTPATTFVGETTPVQYEITDALGSTARAALTVTVDPLPVARPDAVTTPRHHAVTIDVAADDDPGSSVPPSYLSYDPYPQLPIHRLPPGWKGNTFGDQLIVPGQGVYVVDPGTRAVTFTPEPQFSGTGTPITIDLGEFEHVGRYGQLGGPVFDQEVTSTLTVTVTPSVPHSAADEATTQVGRPVTVPVLANDGAGAGATLVGPSVRLRLAPGLPSGSALYGDAKTLTVPGHGVFLVAGDGAITFVPIGSRTGPAPVVGYQVADTNGTTTRSSVEVTVRQG